MQAEPFEIRALARRIRHQGAAARADAHDLVARSRAVGWTGMTGAAMVSRTTAQADVLRRIAEQHETAARAFEAHAAAVEASLALIAEIERRVNSAVDGAWSRLTRFLGGLLDTMDPSDEVLAHFIPPPPGSPQWLEVRLPGVTLPGPRR